MAHPTRNQHLGDDTSSKLEELPLLSSCDIAYLGGRSDRMHECMSLGGLALVSRKQQAQRTTRQRVMIHSGRSVRRSSWPVIASQMS